MRAARHESEDWSPRALVFAAAGLLIAVIVAYIPAFHAGFIWDDDSYVTQNPLLRDLDGLQRIWIPGETPQYYPAVFASFWIEYQLWGLDPRGYHAVNVVLHAVNAVLTFLLMRRLRVPGALLIGAVFAVHPIMVESVAWITERKNVLSMCFFLLSALAYLRFDRMRFGCASWGDGRGASHDDADHRQAWGWYGAALVLFLGALLSKTVTCSLPAALVLALLWMRQPMRLSRLLPLAPMFVIGFALAMITVALERTHVGASGEDFSMSFLERLLIACRALLFYPQKLLWPSPLMFIYPRWDVGVTAAAFVPLVIVLLIAGACAVLWRRGFRGPVLAICLYAGMVFPALGFFNVYPHLFSFVADHFVYHASIGLIALFAGGGAYLVSLRPRLRFAASGAAVVVLLLLMFKTFTHAAVFTDLQTLYRHNIALHPQAWMPRNNLSSELLRYAEAALRAGDERMALALAEEAAEHAEAVLALKPEHHTSWSNLSEARRLKGDLSAALEAMREAVRLLPAHAEYHWMEGRLLQMDGDPEAAIEAYDRAHAEAHREDELAQYRFRVAAARAAVQAARALREEDSRRADDLLALAGEGLGEALARFGGSYEALSLAASVRLEQRDDVGAWDLLLRALQAAPDAGERSRVMAIMIRRSLDSDDPSVRSTERAQMLAEELVRMTGGTDPAALSVLATVRAAAGDLSEATMILDQAISIARSNRLDALLASLLRQRDALADREAGP